MTPTTTEFIKATGIQKQREAMEEKLKLQTAKQKMRERVNPKVRPSWGFAWLIGCWFGCGVRRTMSD